MTAQSFSSCFLFRVRLHFEFAVISLMLLHCPRVIHAGMECLRVSALLSRVIALVIGRTPPKPETIVAPFSWTWSVARHHAMKAWKIVYYIGIYTFWHMYIISYVWVCVYLSHIHSHTHRHVYFVCGMWVCIYFCLLSSWGQFQEAQRHRNPLTLAHFAR